MLPLPLLPLPLLLPLPALPQVGMLGQYVASLRYRQSHNLGAAGKLFCQGHADRWSRLQAVQLRNREQHDNMRPLNAAGRHWRPRPGVYPGAYPKGLGTSAPATPHRLAETERKGRVLCAGPRASEALQLAIIAQASSPLCCRRSCWFRLTAAAASPAASREADLTQQEPHRLPPSQQRCVAWLRTVKAATLQDDRMCATSSVEQ